MIELKKKNVNILNTRFKFNLEKQSMLYGFNNMNKTFIQIFLYNLINNTNYIF